MKNVLILAYTDLLKDPRPFRQIKLLKMAGYDITTIGLSKSNLENDFIELRKVNPIFRLIRLLLLPLGFYDFFYWDVYKRRIKRSVTKQFDLVIAHEVRLLPLALELSCGKPVILDAHEYSPLNFDDNFLWKLFIKKYYNFLCDTYISKVSCILTVSDGIVEMYKKNFNVPTFFIGNFPDFEELKPKVVSGKIRLVHHGIASSSRKLELMIEAMQYLDPDLYELDLILVCNDYSSSYYRSLIKKAKNFSNINFLKPVLRTDLIRFCNQYDLGIIFCPPTNFNIKHGLPNKFFEFVQSRLGVVIGPDIEMSKFIYNYNLGVRAKDWSPLGLASAIKLLNKDEIFRLKANADKASRTLSYVEQDAILLNVINQFL